MSVEWVPHPDGTHRYRWRNTMSGWIEEREPEGIVRVVLPDGFRVMRLADKSEVENDRAYFVRWAETVRARHLAAGHDVP